MCHLTDDETYLGYCFGGPFVLVLATTDDVVAGKRFIHCIFYWLIWFSVAADDPRLNG